MRSRNLNGTVKKRRPAFWAERDFSGSGLRRTLWHHVGGDAAAWIDRFGDGVIVVARNDDWIAVGVNTTNNTDMTMHHRDGADLRAGDARAVTRVAPGDVATAGVTGFLEHHVHEGAAPKTAAAGRIGADVLASAFDQRIAGKAGIGRVGM